MPVVVGPNVTKKEVQDLLTQHQIAFVEMACRAPSASGSSTLGGCHLRGFVPLNPKASPWETSVFRLVFSAPAVTRSYLPANFTAFTIFYTGLFTEFLIPAFDFNNDEGYMTVVGKGETPFSIAPRTDVGRFVAHVLIAFEAERLAPLQIHGLIDKKLSKKIKVRHIDYEKNKKKFDSDFVAWITTLIEDGRGVVGTEEEVQESLAKFFPDWNPVRYESFIQ
ncbi:hypothetical protein V7S43_009774 [Phytophthora oleae]|uniref:NmrA-like domain-containing protein n=1 Tax=Phytophthora oleae TaxID=2107226 RepID=A0ABD3FFR4_9STRA